MTIDYTETYDGEKARLTTNSSGKAIGIYHPNTQKSYFQIILTQAGYDALAVKDANTLYIIVG